MHVLVSCVYHCYCHRPTALSPSLCFCKGSSRMRQPLSSPWVSHPVFLHHFPGSVTQSSLSVTQSSSIILWVSHPISLHYSPWSVSQSSRVSYLVLLHHFAGQTPSLPSSSCGSIAQSSRVHYLVFFHHFAGQTPGLPLSSCGSEPLSSFFIFPGQSLRLPSFFPGSVTQSSMVKHSDFKKKKWDQSPIFPSSFLRVSAVTQSSFIIFLFVVTQSSFIIFRVSHPVFL